MKAYCEHKKQNKMIYELIHIYISFFNTHIYIYARNL